MANLSLSHEIGHRVDRLLDRHLGVRSVQIVKVDGVHSESPQRSLARVANVLRPPIDTLFLADLRHETKLRRQDDVCTSALDGLADLHLGITVDVRGIEEGHTKIDRALNQRDRGVVIMDAARVDVTNAETHAAEANG